MALYDRLIGRDDSGNGRNIDKIAIHGWAALMAEFARGKITGAQAQAAVERLSGSPLTASEVTEAQTLLGTVTGTLAQKLARAKEIDDTLMLAEGGVAEYDTPTEVKTRLGV